MKAILEFNLPEDKDEYDLAINGAKYHVVIEATLNLIRNKLKYDKLSDQQQELLEEIRGFINEEMED